MRLLVFSQSGQVAHELAGRMPPDMAATFLSHEQAYLADPGRCAATTADALITAALAIADGAQGGTHHFTGTTDTTGADCARVIKATAGLRCIINDIPSSVYPTPARWPQNSRLDCTAFIHDFGISRPNRRDGLANILQELRAG